MSPLHYRTCSLCEALCGLVIAHEGGRVVSIRGDDDDPFSRGHICPKGVALQDVHHDPDRLRRPVRRDGSRWIEMEWDEAFDLVAGRLRRVQREHGHDAVAVYLGNPTAHSLGALLFAPPFVRTLRTRNRFSATSVDQLPHHLAATLMFGHGLLLPIPDLDRTDLLFILGANPAASNGSLMSAGDVKGRMRGIRERGGRIVVIDPRRTETAMLADEHHFIRPGTDALLLLAMLHVIFAEGLFRERGGARFATGGDELRALASAWTPERVANATGIDANTIRRLARDFARAERAACYGRVGVSMQEFGTLCAWLVNALNAVTGQLDERGGVMFTEPAVEVVRRGGGLGARRVGRWKSRVRGLPEYAGELPVAALAEEIETPGEGQVRSLVTHAGNPVLSTPNGARLDRAIRGLDFYVAIDFYVNATTRHAHVILPPTGPLERDHYDLVFNALAVRNVARYAAPMAPRSVEARHDWEIFSALTRRLSRGSVLERARHSIAGRLGARGMLDLALRFGPFGAGINPFARGLSVARLERSPHGEDLGSLQPCLEQRLRTEDRKVHLAPDPLVRDVARLEHRLNAMRDGTAEETLSLIGRRQLRSNNSWMHNSERLVRGKARCTLLVHPADAARHGLVDGATVHVRSRTGTIRTTAEITDDVMPGVVSLPHGWGHALDGVRLSVAVLHAGVSLNDVTDDSCIDALSGNAAFSGVRVSLAPERTPHP